MKINTYLYTIKLKQIVMEKKKYILKKDLRFGTVSIDASNKPFVNKHGFYFRGTFMLPDFIDINNSNYFEEYIETNFKIGEYVLFKEFSETWQPQRIIDIKIVNNKPVYDIENLLDKKSKLKVSEKDLLKTAEYYFINSDGKTQREFYGTHPMKDAWLIGSGNYFIDKDTANRFINSHLDDDRIKTFKIENNIG